MINKINLIILIMTSIYFSLPIIHVESNSIIKTGKIYAQESIPKINGGDMIKPNDNSLTTVMIIVMIVWIGISIYLFTIDRKVKKLEQDLNEVK